MVVSPNPQPTSSTLSPFRMFRDGKVASLCCVSPPTKICLKRMNFGASTSFQNWTKAVSPRAGASVLAVSVIVSILLFRLLKKPIPKR